VEAALRSARTEQDRLEGIMEDHDPALAAFATAPWVLREGLTAAECDLVDLRGGGASRWTHADAATVPAFTPSGHCG
jgi:hypothetical protein